MHCDVWGMRNNLHAWAEHCPVTLNNVIHGGTGSTSGHNFDMGTQNGLKLEF